MYQKSKHIYGFLFIIALFLVTIIPTSVKASSYNDFLIKDGVLVAYYGSDKTVTIPGSVKEIGKRAIIKIK